MKTFIIIFLFLMTFTADAVVQLDFYFQPGCSECEKIKQLLLPELAEKFPNEYILTEFDLGIEENFLQFIAVQDKLQVTNDNSPAAIVINNRHYIGGFAEAERRLVSTVASELNSLESNQPSVIGSKTQITSRAEQFTVVTIAAAGLIDGVNPCVFATLIFFMSLLTVSKIKGKTLLMVGLAYCAAGFITYLLLGFGIFRALKLLSHYQILQNLLEYVMMAILGLFAGLSLYDAWRFKRSGQSAKITLQLPDTIKNRIHKIMRNGLKMPYLVLGAFIIGVSVTLLESVCTGQVYLPILVLMTKEHGIGYLWGLLLYNIMFILPLIAIFIIVYRGVNSQKLLLWSKQNVIWGKLLLCILFSALAVMLWIF